MALLVESQLFLKHQACHLNALKAVELGIGLLSFIILGGLLLHLTISVSVQKQHLVHLFFGQIETVLERLRARGP